MSPDPQDLLYFNGIDGETGNYSLPPRSAADLASAFTEGEAPEGAPENLSELRHRHKQKIEKHLGAIAEVDVKDLGQAGWGIIFSKESDPAIMEALKPLIDLRQTQAGDYFRCYEGDKAYSPGESKGAFLVRHGAAPGPADPEKVPYYLLIAGSPEEIPYRFQSQLDVQYAVGRIHFETLQEYANYAQSVVDAEKKKVRLPRRAAFFGVANGFEAKTDDPKEVRGDPATKMSADALVEPLFRNLQADHADWEMQSYMYQEATKEQMGRLLGGDQTPALLFSATHGMKYGLQDPQRVDWQMARQGALICQDWPGPRKWQGKGPVPEDHYFAGDDIGDDKNLLGLISLFFACFGAGTPLRDEYAKKYLKSTREPIAPYPFVAQLPRRMMAHPKGGALAIIGHVERAWPYSISWPSAGPQIAHFESTLKRLLEGYPVGAAIEFFNERYAELAVMLSDELEEIEFGKKPDPGQLISMWTANNDARGYAIIGDPAVRLPVVEGQNKEQSRQAIQPVEIVGAAVVKSRQKGESPVADPAGQTSSETAVAGETEVEPDFDRPYSPLPTVPPGYRDTHPELYAAWVKHIENGYENNDEVFGRVLDAFMRSHKSTLIMYWILFSVGIALFVVAAYLALVQGEVIAGAVFGGLSVASFLTYFISRPTQAIEENLHFIAWLGVIYNSYWTHLAWSFDERTAQAELEKTTKEAIEQLNVLIDKHAIASSRRPRFGK